MKAVLGRNPRKAHNAAHAADSGARTPRDPPGRALNYRQSRGLRPRGAASAPGYDSSRRFAASPLFLHS